MSLRAPVLAAPLFDKIIEKNEKTNFLKNNRYRKSI